MRALLVQLFVHRHQGPVGAVVLQPAGALLKIAGHAAGRRMQRPPHALAVQPTRHLPAHLPCVSSPRWLRPGQATLTDQANESKHEACLLHMQSEQSDDCSMLRVLTLFELGLDGALVVSARWTGRARVAQLRPRRHAAGARARARRRHCCQRRQTSRRGSHGRHGVIAVVRTRTL